MKYLSYIAVLLAALLAGACSDTEQFRVNGTIKGKPTQNLRAGYYADGVYRTVITAVREGEFEFFASSTQPTLLELTDYEYRPIGRLYVVNGETYTIEIDPADPYAVKSGGSEVNERWSAFLRDNADALRSDANAAVARYVEANPADIVSTLLMLTAYNSSDSPEKADSLMALIAPEARPSSLTDGYTYLLQRLVSETALGHVGKVRYIDMRDSLATFDTAVRPASLIAVTAHSERGDSVITALRGLYRRHGSSKFGILDFSVDADTVVWHRAVRSDSTAWKHGWTPGGLAGIGVDSLGVPSVPFFVVCDTTGTQLYRGASVTRAAATVDSILKTL
ncbi:MAG: hypothetical protein K2K22_09430 [Muribaculaceae bacterium]|nr:hypothetical protein [Muribaculaceae bacterium]